MAEKLGFTHYPRRKADNAIGQLDYSIGFTGLFNRLFMIINPLAEGS
jgi:hypothetical protein